MQKFWHLIPWIPILMQCLAGTQTMASFPNPQINVTECQNNGILSLCDAAGLFSTAEKTNISATIDKLESTLLCEECTNCAAEKGLKFGVATLNSTSSSWSTFELNLVKEILSSWKLSACGNDIVLLLSVYTHKAYIASGGTATLHLPAKCSVEVAAAGTNSMTKRDYLEAVLAVAASLEANYRAPKSSNLPSCFTTDPAGLSSTVIVLIVLAIVLPLALTAFGVYQCTSSRRQHYLNYRSDALNGQVTSQNPQDPRPATRQNEIELDVHETGRDNPAYVLST